MDDLAEQCVKDSSLCSALIMGGLLSASSDPKNKGHESASQERIETPENVSLGTNEVSADNKQNLSHDNVNVDSPEQSHAGMFSILSSVPEVDKLHSSDISNNWAEESPQTEGERTPRISGVV